MNHYLVFDVESVGLHGEAFAVGYVVVDENGKRFEEDLLACDPQHCKGTQQAHAWVQEHVPTLRENCTESIEVRSAFWRALQKFRHTYMPPIYDESTPLVWADCGWPVEARFLAACVDDVSHDREWDGPYPLHDIATVALAKGFDPLKIHDRLPDELPAHNPLCDARQSARLLVALLKGEAI